MDCLRCFVSATDIIQQFGKKDYLNKRNRINSFPIGVLLPPMEKNLYAYSIGNNSLDYLLDQ